MADLLPPDWTLVGGLMLQLHALERDLDDVRVTVDIDALAEARPPGPLQAIDEALVDAGFEPILQTQTTTLTATSARD